jgi:hypothetical protein
MFSLSRRWLRSECRPTSVDILHEGKLFQNTLNKQAGPGVAQSVQPTVYGLDDRGIGIRVPVV